MTHHVIRAVVTMLFTCFVLYLLSPILHDGAALLRAATKYVEMRTTQLTTCGKDKR